MKELATRENPLRPSALAKLLECPWRFLAEKMNVIGDDVGRAADTGNAVHSGVARFHMTSDIEKGLQALNDSLQQFPKADAKEAELIYRHYVNDPRNSSAEVVYLEQRVELELPCHPDDPTGQPIVVVGTLDQIRRENGVLRLWDLKTGQTYDGYTQLQKYALQQSAYLLAARQKLGDVQPGGLICTKGYRTRGAELPSPSGVFWYSPVTVESALFLMESVKLMVALLRQGEVMPIPGGHCVFCPFKSVDNCTRIALEMTNG